MTSIPTLTVVEIGDIPTWDSIYNAWIGDVDGWAMSPRVCALDDPTNTPCGALQNNEGQTLEQEAILRAMATAQDLPPITGTWGEDGVVDAATAQDAMTRLRVVSTAGPRNCSIPEWVDQQLAIWGLRIVPPTFEV